MPSMAVSPLKFREISSSLLITFLLINRVFARTRGRSNEDVKETTSLCPLLPRPSFWEKAKTARWMVHTLDWGVMSTISTRDVGGGEEQQPIPFGNVYSFVDGPCGKSTGTPYLYGTALDQSFQDIAANPTVSLTLSEASFSDGNGLRSCTISPGGYGDPESPPCARLVLTGEFVPLGAGDGGFVEDKNDELIFAMKALTSRHPAMEKWPEDHHFFAGKIVIKDIWLIDFFGGPAIIDLD